MPNDPHHDRFIPEAIDEQIAQLKQGSQSDSADARLVRDLARTYREEQEEEQAIERIRARLMVKMQAAGEQQVSQLSGELSQRKRIGHMNTHRERTDRRQWQQKWSVLAAAVVVTLVVGSLIAVLQLAHRNQPEGKAYMEPTEQPTTATKKAPSTDPGLYLGLINQLVKVDKQTHKVLWRFVVKSDPKDRPMFQHPQVHDTPIVANGMVYFTAQTGRVYAVDAQTGKLHWVRNFQAELWSLKMADGTLYVNTEWDEKGNPTSLIYALNPTDGTTRTKYNATGQIAGIFDGIMYLNSRATLTAVKMSDGSQVWATIIDAKGQQRLNTSVYLKNGKLYASSAHVSQKTADESQDSYVYVIDPKNGKITWTSPVMNGFVFDIAIGDDGRIYCGAQNHYVYAFDPRLKSLKELWKYHTIVGHVYPAPIVQDNIVYVGQSSAGEQNGNDDHLVALAAASGQQIWATPLKGYTGGGDTEPLVLHNGVIYLSTAGGLQGFATDSGKQVMMIPSDLLVSKKDVGDSGFFGGIAITIVD
jgi:outer membrane protein assembly factor BamB